MPGDLSPATADNELTENETKAFRLMRSNVVDIVQFVNREEVDPLYRNTSYYVYPDGELAAEPLRVVAEKMAAKGLFGDWPRDIAQHPAPRAI